MALIPARSRDPLAILLLLLLPAALLADCLFGGRTFLPFDLDSFIYDNEGDPHTGGAHPSQRQEDFRQLNAFVLATHPEQESGNANQPVTALLNFWYPAGVNTAGSTFQFTEAVIHNL